MDMVCPAVVPIHKVNFNALETLQLNNQGSRDKLSRRIYVLVTVKSLKVLWLQSNAFTGQILDFSGLELVEFNVMDNLPTGPVPTSLTEMGDHKEVFRSLQEFFPQVDHRTQKAITIVHSKDVDSAFVAVLDEVMPSMTGLAGVLSAHHGAMPSAGDSVGNLFANSTCDSSSAGHDTHVEADGSMHSALHTSSVEVN
jgi:hypothetical protein